MKIFETAKNRYWDICDRLSKPYAKYWLATIGRTVPFGDPCASPHEFVVINDVQLDTGIAPLVELLWYYNIETVNSCQGDPSLDSRAYALAPNFYGNCFSASVSIVGMEHAKVFSDALVNICELKGLNREKHRVSTVIPALDQQCFHVNFPASLLLTENFLREVSYELQDSGIS